MRGSLRVEVLLLFLVGRCFASEVGPRPYVSYASSGEAMGNAVVSLPAHPSNTWTNPAGLAFLKGCLFYAAPHDEVSGYRDKIRDRIFAASAGRAGGQGFGAALIVRQNSDDAVQIGDQPLVSTDIWEPSLFLAYGRMLTGKIAGGVSLLGYQHRADVGALDGDPTVGLTGGILRVWDHSLRGKLPLEIRWGLTAANVGPSFDFGTGSAELPLHFRTGVSSMWRRDAGTRLVGAGDLYYLPRKTPSDKDGRFGGGIGAELTLAATAAIRLGFLWDEERDRSDATYGFGIGNEVYPHVGGMIEYAHAPGEGDFADHLGVRVYYIP